MLIIRGYPADEQTQLGFVGSCAQVLQQRTSDLFLAEGHAFHPDLLPSHVSMELEYQQRNMPSCKPYDRLFQLYIKSRQNSENKE